MEPTHPTPPSSFFHRLPAAVFSLVTQFLPLSDKLLQLTRVSRSFPLLTPHSFACDTLAWTPSLMMDHFDNYPPSPLLSLLAQVPFAVCVDADVDLLFPLCRLLDPPSSTSSFSSPFSALRAVCLAPVGAAAELDDFLPIPLAGLRHCPHLTALDLSLKIQSFWTRSNSDYLANFLPQLPLPPHSPPRRPRRLRLTSSSCWACPSPASTSTAWRSLSTLRLHLCSRRSPPFKPFSSLCYAATPSRPSRGSRRSCPPSPLERSELR